MTTKISFFFINTGKGLGNKGKSEYFRFNKTNRKTTNMLKPIRVIPHNANALKHQSMTDPTLMELYTNLLYCWKTCQSK